ncbi:MAG: hypothetical protein K2X90_01425 [Candidatus Babeliaceae bacterium]|nr:hypothetical protein [Candidatus Babeliaceae bacterium]
MENFSKRYAEVQLLLLDLKKATVSYEDNSEQTQADSQALISIFSKAFYSFCELIAEYLKIHHKNFASSKSPREVIENAHRVGFLAEHDTHILLQIHKDRAKPLLGNEESALIHKLETYIETMQTIVNEIKP